MVSYQELLSSFSNVHTGFLKVSLGFHSGCLWDFEGFFWVSCTVSLVSHLGFRLRVLEDLSLGSI